MNFSELIAECETHLRNGRADLVNRRLFALKVKDLPRSMRLPLASLCRRAGLINMGLRMLAPVVRPDGPLGHDEASDSEKCEYAFLIMKSGSVREALKILAPLTESPIKEARLYVGYCHILSWDHEAAIPHLTAYLNDMDDSYAKKVVQVNLAAALVSAEHWAESLQLLSEILADAKAQGLTRLQGNCLELRSQVHLHTHEFTKCRADLDEAARLLEQERSSDQLFVVKWKSILEALTSRSEEPLRLFQKEALLRQHWESVRECDLFSLKINFDRRKFEKLYFGTPYASYRKRILREIQRTPETNSFLWGHDGGDGELDLYRGILSTSSATEKLTPMNQLLFVSLFRDLYRPISIGGLFANLMPEEYFNPFTSPNRIHQILFRARKWIKERRLPIEITEDSGQFSPQLTAPFHCLIPLETEDFRVQEIHLDRLKERFGQRRFKSHEARAVLALSKDSFFQFANWALLHQRLFRTGKSNATWYRLANTAESGF